MAGLRAWADSTVIEFHRRTDGPSEKAFQRQRGKDVLDNLFARLPEHQQALQRAHAMLSGDPNYASAMHAAASALHAGRINVFVSYRAAVDGAAAQALADAFRTFLGGKVQVTLQADFTKRIAGRDYREEIARAIARAHWFVLLLSSSKEIGEWCMYETGMFRASMISKHINRLICIHHPDAALPEPIKEFQAIRATPEHIGELLDGLFRGEQPLPGWDPLYPPTVDVSLPMAAARIAKAFRGPPRPISINCEATLEVCRPSELAGDEDLDRCRVLIDSDTARLFGKLRPPDTWGELVGKVRRGGAQDKWLTELRAIIVKTSRNDEFRPITGTFESRQSGRVMRPIVESMEYDSARETYRFRLIFVEDIHSAPVQSETVSPAVLTFLNAVKTHNRLRWELIERFRDVSWDEQHIEACARVFSRIERVGQSFSQWDLDLLSANYSDAKAPEIRQIIERWRQLRRTGCRSGDDGPGELDEALRTHDVGKMPSLIRECAELVSRFFKLSYPVIEDLNDAR